MCVLFCKTQEIRANDVDRCTKAQAVLVDSASTCGDAFYTFLMAYSNRDGMNPFLPDSINQICQQESCKSAASEYLVACADLDPVSVK